MPTYVLRPGDTHTVAPVPLEVDLRGAGASACRVALRHGDDPAPDGELRVTRGATILTRPKELPTDSVLRLEPRVGDIFPLDCPVEVVLASTQRVSDPVLVRLELAPSGLPRLDVIQLAWNADRLVLTALKAGPPPPRNPVAKRAYEVSRMILGGVEAGGQGADASVVLDPSPSMDHWVKAGAVAAAIEVLAGLDHAVGRSEGVEIGVGSASTEQSFAADEAAEGGLALLERAEPGVWTELQGLESSGDRVRVVVTDLAPTQAGTRPGIVHLVLCEPGVAPILATGPRVVPMTWRKDEDIAQWLTDAAFADLVKQLYVAIGLDQSEESNA